MGPLILGHEGLKYQILAENNYSSYVKQISHSQYGLKVPNPHDLTQQKLTEAYAVWFSEGYQGGFWSSHSSNKE